MLLDTSPATVHTPDLLVNQPVPPTALEANSFHIIQSAITLDADSTWTGSMENNADEKGPCYLLSIPQEIRDMIASHPATSFVWVDASGPVPYQSVRYALSKTSKQLHVEYRDQYYRNTVFGVDLRSKVHRKHKIFRRFASMPFVSIVQQVSFYCPRFTARVRVAGNKLELCAVKTAERFERDFGTGFTMRLTEFLQALIEQNALISTKVDWIRIYEAVGLVNSAYCVKWKRRLIGSRQTVRDLMAHWRSCGCDSWCCGWSGQVDEESCGNRQHTRYGRSR